jgi:hypothetical protein
VLGAVANRRVAFSPTSFFPSSCAKMQCTWNLYPLEKRRTWKYISTGVGILPTLGRTLGMAGTRIHPWRWRWDPSPYCGYVDRLACRMWLHANCCAETYRRLNIQRLGRELVSLVVLALLVLCVEVQVSTPATDTSQMVYTCFDNIGVWFETHPTYNRKYVSNVPST